MKIKNVKTLADLRTYGRSAIVKLSSKVSSGISDECFGTVVNSITRIMVKSQDGKNQAYYTYYANAIKAVKDTALNSEIDDLGVSTIIGKVNTTSELAFTNQTIESGLFDGMPDTKNFGWLRSEFRNADGQTIEALSA